MTAALFLAPTAALEAGDEVVLTGAEARHAAVVRRVEVGERIDAGDGAGLVVRGEVVAAAPDAVRLRVLGRERVPAPRPRLVVVQALAKGDRAEDAVEAMTEVGVDEIMPWAAARSVVRWDGARGERARQRWEATAREAAKQSRRAWLPVVAPLATTTDVAVRLRAAALPVVLHESATRPLSGVVPPADGEVVVVVGPEGGLTDEELAALGAPYRLGPGVLRTSTAGVVAAAVLLARTDRWGAQ